MGGLEQYGGGGGVTDGGVILNKGEGLEQWNTGLQNTTHKAGGIHY